jgi:hypothetical protein
MGWTTRTLPLHIQTGRCQTSRKPFTNLPLLPPLLLLRDPKQASNVHSQSREYACFRIEPRRSKDTTCHLHAIRPKLHAGRNGADTHTCDISRSAILRSITARAAAGIYRSTVLPNTSSVTCYFPIGRTSTLSNSVLKHTASSLLCCNQTTAKITFSFSVFEVGLNGQLVILAIHLGRI